MYVESKKLVQMDLFPGEECSGRHQTCVHTGGRGGRGKLESSSNGKESACNVRDLGSIPGSGRSLGEVCLPTLVFLLGEFHG